MAGNVSVNEILRNRVFRHNFKGIDMNTTLLFLLASVLAAEPGGPATAPKKTEATASDDKKAIQGVWYLETMNYEGKVQGEDSPIKEMIMEFTSDKVLSTAKKEKTESEYTIDSSSAPKKIDLIRRHDMEDHIAHGIYQLEENTLTICVAMPDKDRPADFKPGEGRAVMVLKRKQPKDK
jgi:uncharacterized protein (TIGR03067 family)